MLLLLASTSRLWRSSGFSVPSAPSRLARRAEPSAEPSAEKKAKPSEGSSSDSEGMLKEYKTEYLIAIVALIVLGTVFNPFQ